MLPVQAACGQQTSSGGLRDTARTWFQSYAVSRSVRIVSALTKTVSGAWRGFLSLFLAIWLTHRNQTQSAGSVAPVLVLEGLLKTRLKGGTCILSDDPWALIIHFRYFHFI